VFDWPLSAAEIHRSLSVACAPADVDDVLASGALAAQVASVDEMFVLFGRTELAESRRRRERVSQRLWPHAVRYGRWIAGLPLVSMVAVSGSLAVNAATSDADIDLFIVTDDGRLWTARAMTMGVVRAAALGRNGVTLCPNYLVAASKIELAERNLFTAREFAQLVPLYGGRACDDLIARNGWFRDFLPNHPGPTPKMAGKPPALGRHVAPLLSSRVFGAFERWEMERKVATLRALSGATAGNEANFGAGECKGHVDGHRQRILGAYADRLRRLGVAP